MVKLSDCEDRQQAFLEGTGNSAGRKFSFLASRGNVAGKAGKAPISAAASWAGSGELHRERWRHRGVVS